MYDLKELTRYVELTDKGIKFPQIEPRKIILEVLAENETSLYVIDQGVKSKPFYIGTFHGYDVVKFNVLGAAILQASGAGVRVWTPEFQSEIIEIPDAVSFTRTMTRRQRNPELEKIAHTMQLNMERRLMQVERDVTLRVSQQMRDRHAEAERERFERATEEEAQRLNVGSDDDANQGEDEPAPDKPAAKSGDNVPGGGGKAKGQKLAAKPAT